MSHAALAAALAYDRDGAYANAEELYRKVLRGEPGNTDVQHLLGRVLGVQKKNAEALQVLTAMVRDYPHLAEPHLSLAVVQRNSSLTVEAAATLRKLTALQPGLAGAWAMLGEVLNAMGEVDAAEDAFRRALELDPTLVGCYSNLGVNLMTQGRVAEAVAAYRTAISIDPGAVGAHSNLVYALNFEPSASPGAVLAAHVEWAEHHAKPLENVLPPPQNDRSPSRRLRIGYVSPDFRQHSVAQFFEPVLAHHDRASFEVFCYSDVRKPDACTDRLKSYDATWRDITTLSDHDAALAIREDRIDVLVDLAGHTDRNRLLVFARKAAPVQVTWSGYINTTGMSVMDYRITDAFMDPPGASEHLYTESLARLPRIYQVFQPTDDAPPPGPSPASAHGYVTYACFNGRFKVSAGDIAAWADILRRVPQSRLLLAPVCEGKTRRELVDVFARHGIAPERLEFRTAMPYDEYLELHRSVDVVLDTCTAHGVTTTSHSLWMGVPVIVRAGDACVSRAGVSLLSNAGLAGLVAGSRDEYVDIAVALGHDIARQATLRAELRSKLAAAPNTDGAALCAELARAYRRMWYTWCGL